MLWPNRIDGTPGLRSRIKEKPGVRLHGFDYGGELLNGSRKFFVRTGKLFGIRIGVQGDNLTTQWSNDGRKDLAGSPVGIIDNHPELCFSYLFGIYGLQKVLPVGFQNPLGEIELSGLLGEALLKSSRKKSLSTDLVLKVGRSWPPPLKKTTSIWF